MRMVRREASVDSPSFAFAGGKHPAGGLISLIDRPMSLHLNQSSLVPELGLQAEVDSHWSRKFLHSPALVAVGGGLRR